MHFQYFIFNYGHFYEAKELFDRFAKEGCDVYLLNCHSDRDPDFEETDHVRKFPNIYYSGQWNEALKLLTGDIIFITNADVRIPSIPRLIRNMKRFYLRDNAGLYAPNHYWTPWTYNPALLEDVGNGLKVVPGTDSTIWSVKTEYARKLGQIDLAVNKLGWGIEIITAWYCYLDKKLVVRDYSIKCEHPEHSNYDRNKADHEWRRMIANMRIDNSFWDYYGSVHKYGFGWRGDDRPKSELLLL
jgi:hypothetical protein